MEENIALVLFFLCCYMIVGQELWIPRMLEGRLR